MKIVGAKILKTSFSYGNTIKEQVAKYLYYPTLHFNISQLFVQDFKSTEDVPVAGLHEQLCRDPEQMQSDIYNCVGLLVHCTGENVQGRKKAPETLS